MKVKYIAILAAAAAMLSFSACGDTSEGGTSTDSITKIEAGQAENTAAADTAQEGALESAAVAANESAADDTPTLVDDDTSGTDSANDDPMAIKMQNPGAAETVGEHAFKTPNGDYTYDSLNADGLSNNAGGKFYCLVPSDGGAGHLYYQCYYSTDGKEWNEAGVYDEASGSNYHYALPDGRIILFNWQGPISSNVPLVSAISFTDANTVASTPVNDFFKDQYLDDGTLLTSAEGLGFFVTYNGGYNFTFSFTDEYGNIVYNVNTDLDSTSLLMS